MIWVTFGFGNFNKFSKILGTFYLLCFVFGGAIISLHYILNGGDSFDFEHRGKISWLLIITSFPLVWIYVKISFNNINETISISNYITEIRVRIEEKIISCKGLIDTGNQLVDPITRKPVIVIDLKEIVNELPPLLVESIRNKNWDNLTADLPLNWLRKIQFLSYKVAGESNNVMLTLKPKEIEIFYEKSWHNTSRVLIGIEVGHLSTDGSYQAIINPACLSMN